MVSEYLPPLSAPDDVVTAALNAGGYHVVEVSCYKVTAPKSVGPAAVAVLCLASMQREPLVLSITYWELYATMQMPLQPPAAPVRM